MSKVSLYSDRATPLGTDQLYLFANGRDWRASLASIKAALFGSAASLDAGIEPGDLVMLDVDGLIPLGLLPAEAIGGGEGGGSGDVVGPAGVTADRVALFNGPTGKLLKQGPALGTAASLNAGTGADEVLKLDPDGKLDASLVKNLPTGGGTFEPLHTFDTVWTTAARDLAIADNRKRLRATNATPVLTIRAQTDVAYVANTLVEGTSLNRITITAAAGVTINGTVAGSVKIPGQTDFSILRLGTNDWLVIGLSAAALLAALQLLSASATEAPAAGDALVAIIQSRTGTPVFVPDPTGKDPSMVLGAAMEWIYQTIIGIEDVFSDLNGRTGSSRLSADAIAPGAGQKKLTLTVDAGIQEGDNFALRAVSVTDDGVIAEGYGGEAIDVTETSLQGIEVISGGGDAVPRVYTREELAVAFGAVPLKTWAAAHTFDATDAQHIHLHTEATARTWTIPANSAVPYPVGTTFQIVNGNGAGAITLAITTDTLRMAGAGTTGSRTIAANGAVTALKVAPTEWFVFGLGLS